MTRLDGSKTVIASYGASKDALWLLAMLASENRNPM
jgi:hypothetical protein